MLWIPSYTGEYYFFLLWPQMSIDFSGADDFSGAESGAECHQNCINQIVQNMLNPNLIWPRVEKLGSGGHWDQDELGKRLAGRSRTYTFMNLSPQFLAVSSKLLGICRLYAEGLKSVMGWGHHPA